MPKESALLLALAEVDRLFGAAARLVDELGLLSGHLSGTEVHGVQASVGVGQLRGRQAVARLRWWQAARIPR